MDFPRNLKELTTMTPWVLSALQSSDEVQWDEWDLSAEVPFDQNDVVCGIVRPTLRRRWINVFLFTSTRSDSKLTGWHHLPLKGRPLCPTRSWGVDPTTRLCLRSRPVPPPLARSEPPSSERISRPLLPHTLPPPFLQWWLPLSHLSLTKSGQRNHTCERVTWVGCRLSVGLR